MAAAWITRWQRASFGRAWYDDALREAENDGGVDSHRREIVFASCLAETYLYEWVRDHVYPDEERLEEVFSDKRLGIRDRWKTVLKSLNGDGRIDALPDFGTARWQAFDRLTRFRDGLVHGGASRPEDVTDPGSMEPPVPAVSDLESMEPGWALNVVVDEIGALHASAGSSPPDWLVRFSS